MKKQRHHYPIKLMARILYVSRSGFYAWTKRSPSARQLHDNAVKPLIEAEHKRCRKTYGSVRLQKELANGGTVLGRDHISRLRRELGLKCIQKKKFKATTNSNHELPIEPNLLDQDFKIFVPGTVYGTDITYSAPVY